MIAVAIPDSAPVIGAMDASFCPKSGKHTYGLDWFYNGSASRSQKGLEISLIAVVDVAEARAYPYQCNRLPPTSIGSRARAKATRSRQHESAFLNPRFNKFENDLTPCQRHFCPC